MSLQTSVVGLYPCRHQSLVFVLPDISRWSLSLRTAVVGLTDWSSRVLFQTTVVGSLSFLTTVIGLRHPSRQRPCWSSVLVDNSHWSRMFLQTTVFGLYRASFEKTVVGLECPCRQQSLDKSVRPLPDNTSRVVLAVTLQTTVIGLECSCRQQSLVYIGHRSRQQSCWSRVSLRNRCSI